MEKNIFRKEAVEKISSSENLDTHINLVSPAKWLILAAFGIIFISALVWSVTGSIPTKEKGSGILLNTNNIMMLQSPSTGRITILDIKPGDDLRKGQIIARIAQPKIEEKMELLTKRIRTLKQNLDDIDRLNKSNLTREISYFETKEENCNSEISTLEQNKAWLEELNKRFKILREKGAITEILLHNMQKDFAQTKLDILKQKNELQDINFKKNESISNRKKESLKYKNELEEKILELDELKYDLQSETVYQSPTSGKVLEVSVNLFQLVNKGDNFLTLSSNQKEQDLKAILYLPVSEGKKISNGMDVKISPSTIKTSEYGYIKGIVEYVGEYPVSHEGMKNTLQNDELVEKLSADSAPIEVIISLLVSDNNASGLQWTSSKGPPNKIQNGTICTGTIIISEESPITFILPMMKR